MLRRVVKWNAKNIRRALQADIMNRMKNGAAYLEARCKKYVSQGQPPGQPGGPPHVLRGILRANITHAVIQLPTSGDVVGFLGVRKSAATADIPLQTKTGKALKGKGLRKAKLKAAAQTKLDGYAITLETGNPKRRRPYLRPTVDNNRDGFMQVFKRKPRTGKYGSRLRKQSARFS